MGEGEGCFSHKREGTHLQKELSYKVTNGSGPCRMPLLGRNVTKRG